MANMPPNMQGRKSLGGGGGLSSFSAGSVRNCNARRRSSPSGGENSVITGVSSCSRNSANSNGSNGSRSDGDGPLSSSRHYVGTPMGPAPRRIKRYEGQRLRLLFGQSPSSYLLLMDEDDGSASWQTVLHANLPAGLEEQLVRITEKSGAVTDVAFSPDGRWFLQARFPDAADAASLDGPPSRLKGQQRRGSMDSMHGAKGGSTGSADATGVTGGCSGKGCKKTWWGGCSEKVSSAIEEWCNSSHRLQVSFGDEGQCFLLQGDNGHWDCGYAKVEPGLKSRVDRRYKDGGKIDFIRLFPFYSCSDSYVTSDSEGTKWFGLCEHLANELRHAAAEETVCDVTMSGDQVWVVVYPHHFVESPGVPSNLLHEMKRFVARQRARRERRDREISGFKDAEAAFKEQCRREGQLRETLDVERRTMRTQRERDLEEIRELRVQLEKMRSGSAVRGLRVGMRVTVNPPPLTAQTAGGAKQADAAAFHVSVNPGDAVVAAIDSDHSNNRYEVTVQYDDLTMQVITDVASIEIFDERSRMRNIEGELAKRRLDYRSKRLEMHARRRRLYLWRGLRPDECSAAATGSGVVASPTCSAPTGSAVGVHAATRSGIVAKEPAAALSLEDALLRSASGASSQYVHMTHSAEAAIYYAATFALSDADATAAAVLSCRVAQVDHSLVSESSVFDLSTPEFCVQHGVRDPRAVRYAVDHRVVLVRAYVPPESVVGVHDLRPLGVPRNPPNPGAGIAGVPAPEYLKKLGETVPGMPEHIAGWVRAGVQRLLEEECEQCGRLPTASGIGGGGYPEHVLALAVIRGSVRAPREFEPLWKKIVGHA